MGHLEQNEEKDAQVEWAIDTNLGDTRADIEQEDKQRISFKQKPEIRVRGDQETSQSIGSCRNLERSMDFYTEK